ncbi:MAG: Nramp family divalent metal transporter [Thermoplasmatota archaeon]
MTLRTHDAAREVLDGKRRGWRAILPFAGPAFVASVAYMDPGNFATNIQGGAQFGYRLLWVVLFANLAAMLYQGLSAKLGIATGRNLAELCREHFPRPVYLSMWVVSEVAAMATDLAEFLGATVGLNLLFHLPLFLGAVITAIATYAILSLERHGFRPIEAVIGALVGVMALSYLIETLFAKPDWKSVLEGTTNPWLGDSRAVLLAVGVVGATVMPHAVYIHSELTRSRIAPRNDSEKRKLVKFSNIEVLVALSLAGLVNLAMMYMAAATFHATRPEVADITTAYQTLAPLLGRAAAGVFLVSLLASGFSSSAVGTMAGQVIMQGFLGFSIPLWVRRLVTMLPTLVIIYIGVDPTRALVISQVILSLALPIPLVALLWFTTRKELMGDLVNRRRTSAIAIVGTVTILLLNILLVALVSGYRPF